MSGPDTELSDYAEVEWHPEAAPPVYELRQRRGDGTLKEICLQPEAAEKLAAFVSKTQTRETVTGGPDE